MSEKLLANIFFEVKYFLEYFFHCFISKKVVNSLCTTQIEQLSVKMIFFDFIGVLAIDYKIILAIFNCDLTVVQFQEKRRLKWLC